MLFCLSLLGKDYDLMWRGGRVVEGARLESVYTVYSRIEGSNPSLSANFHFLQTQTIFGQNPNFL